MGNPRDHILHALYIGIPPITIPEAPCIEIFKIFGKYAGNHQILFLIPYTVYIDKNDGPGCNASISIDQYPGSETSYVKTMRCFNLPLFGERHRAVFWQNNELGTHFGERPLLIRV